MHFEEVKGVLSPKGNMNIYRGCTHGCIYCDSRSTCYNMPHDFEDVLVKANAPQLLEQALKSKRKKIMVGMGSMSDPYMHCEKELLHTRKCLEIVDRYGFGFTLITKSDLVLRDLDLIKSINSKSKAVVQMTLTTFDEKLCRILEPNVATTKQRFSALMKLKEAGIPTVVWLTPILPFINDTEDNLRGILDYCIQAGVKGIICFDMGLTLREGNREYFYRKLDEHFPGMKQRYISAFGDSYYCTSPDNRKLMKIFRNVCRENGIMYNTDEIFEYLHTFEERCENEQLTLF
ncbi:MAG: radical SAM protein [Oscillospiraceae bacterium]|nr:radical SAM protein [Oscillospiraceae bacterium]